MEISMELLQKAKTAGSVEELLAMAKKNNIDLTPEDAEKYYSRLHQNGEMSDEELDNVAGGFCSGAAIDQCPYCHSSNTRRDGALGHYKCNACGKHFAVANLYY